MLGCDGYVPPAATEGEMVEIHDDAIGRARPGRLSETQTWLGALWSAITRTLSSMLEPSTSDLDVWRTTNQLIGEHGEDAWAEAQRLATSFAERRDLKRAQYWRRVMKSLDDHRRAGRPRAISARDSK